MPSRSGKRTTRKPTFSNSSRNQKNRLKKHQTNRLRSNKHNAINISQRKVIIFNKPYDTLSQFTDDQDRKTLADYIPVKEVYAAGRLDRDSEGLMILTNDGVLQANLTQPTSKSPKTYWTQVEGQPQDRDLDNLRKGVELKDGLTLPAKIEIMSEPDIAPRNPPIRFRATIPTTWLSITIVEGRNRQVRRMTAHAGFPTLRLIRVSVGDISLEDLKPGEWKEITLP